MQVYPKAWPDRGFTVQMFEEFFSQLGVRIKDGDQAGFYKHLKGIDLEGGRSCCVQLEPRVGDASTRISSPFQGGRVL